MEFERDVMAEKRETLTKLLLQLLEQKSERAQELQLRLKELEENKNATTENFWLIQYQKLLDSKPKVQFRSCIITAALLHLATCVFCL